MKITEYGWSRLKARFPMWITQARTVLTREGPAGLVVRGSRKVLRALRYSADPQAFHRVQYGDWLQNIEPHYLNDTYQKQLLSKMKKKVKFSIILPTWNKSEELISAAINSVIAQTYVNWELCISDGSTKGIEQTKKLLATYEKKYPGKIKVSYLSKVLKELPPINIIENTNNAMSLATGEYCVFMDCDDELSANCLLELARAIYKNPKVIFLYSDFDKIDEAGVRFDPSFWPDWSPHTILSIMYTTHVTCYKRDVLKKLGGIRAGTAGAQDWDLVLRLRGMLGRKQVVHIPKILYHWRMYPGSTALPNSGAKDWAYEAQKKVLNDWITRNHESASVEEGPRRINLRIRFDIVEKPKVCIVIPFRDNVSYLKRCLPSIFQHTTYENFEVLLVDNQSREVATRAYLGEIFDTMGKRCRLVSYDKRYHFGRLNNWAASKTNAEHLLFLNNDTKVLTDGWLAAMLEYSQRPEIACVGAKLLYPDKQVQHAGVIVGLGGAAAHAHRMVPNTYPGYNGWLVGIRNVLAVTAACMMIKRERFFDLGGFDEKFDPGYQDVDFGIRAYEAGYWNVYTPYAVLTHYESVTRFSKRNRKLLPTDEDMAARLRKQWPQYTDFDFSGDPFYNPNLSNSHEDFRIKTAWYPEWWGKRVGLVE
jgi:O-antigen biosynthesis protein